MRRLMLNLTKDDMKPLIFSSDPANCDFSNYEGPVSSVQEFFSKYILYANIWVNAQRPNKNYSLMLGGDSTDSSVLYSYLHFESGSFTDNDTEYNFYAYIQDPHITTGTFYLLNDGRIILYRWNGGIYVLTVFYTP